MSYLPDVYSDLRDSHQHMIGLNNNKENKDLNISLSIKLTERVAAGLLVCLLGLGSSTIPLVLSQGRPEVAIDAGLPTSPPETPQSDSICISQSS